MLGFNTGGNKLATCCLTTSPGVESNIMLPVVYHVYVGLNALAVVYKPIGVQRGGDRGERPPKNFHVIF